MAETPAPLRISTQDVELAAYTIPIVSDVGRVALSAINTVDSLLTTSMDVVLEVTSRIPLISALAPQISYMYFCVARSFVYYPLAGAAYVAMTGDFTEIGRIVGHILDRLSHFVRYEIDYFLNLPRYLLGFEFLPDEFRPTSLGFGAFSLATATNAVDPGTATDTDSRSGVEPLEDLAPTGEEGPGEIPSAVDLTAEAPVLVEETVTEADIMVDSETTSLIEDVETEVGVVTLEEEAAVIEDDVSDATLTDDLKPAKPQVGARSTSSTADTEESSNAPTSESEDKDTDGKSESAGGADGDSGTSDS